MKTESGFYILFARWPREKPHPVDPWEPIAMFTSWNVARQTVRALRETRLRESGLVRDLCLCACGNIYTGIMGIKSKPDWRVIWEAGYFEDKEPPR